MPKIQTIFEKKTKQIKYMLILPKSTMEDLAVMQGDELLIKSVVGNELTFKLKRKADIAAEKKARIQTQLDKLK